MNVTNAIAKVRFSSARPQRVQVARFAQYACDLLCLEPKQELTGTGPCGYYVVAGSGQIRSGKDSKPLSMGIVVDFMQGETYLLVNTSEQRLICLVIGNGNGHS